MNSAKFKLSFYFFVALIFSSQLAYSSPEVEVDSLKNDTLHLAEKLMVKQQQQQLFDSILKIQLKKELEAASGDYRKQNELSAKIAAMESADSLRQAELKMKIAKLRETTSGYPVMLLNDTIFYIYTRTGSFQPKDRAEAISKRIKTLYDDPFFEKDSLVSSINEDVIEIFYKDQLMLAVTELDALWFDEPKEVLAERDLQIIRQSIELKKEQNSFSNWIKRLGMVLLILLGVLLIIKVINYFFKKSKNWIYDNKEKYFHGISFRTSKLLSEDQQVALIYRINNVLRLFTIGLAIYFSLPLLFSLFPETKQWTNTLLSWVLSPAKRVLMGILSYLPNLFTVFVIYFFTSYAVKLVAYLANEIQKGNISLSGFHPDWAMPTFNIIRFLLYAFMLVVIFPYLPGSGSAAFQGVSVFIGLLLSFGSSSAITNMVAGMVITYMRPFKIGDRVKIGDITGDVMEKTMLVTRIRTIKNEDITVPNATVLSSHTINYSTNCDGPGLIVHTTITIGYDVPWQKIHQAMIDAALRTSFILKEPKPFVLQTSLDDFYVAYQINAYTREANKQALIYSELHQHIQDCCNEVGIEILSPHYRAMRDGNMITIPASYLPEDYKAPGFIVENKKE